MTEFQILTAVQNSSKPIDYVQLLNLGKTESNWNPISDEVLIKKLLTAKLLNGEAKVYSTITLSEQGILHLLQLQQQEQDAKKNANNEAKQRRDDNRHDWAIAIVSTLLGSVFGVLGTLLAQFFL